MNFVIPIYIESDTPTGSPVPVFTARPLFFPAPSRQGENLQRVMTRLALDLKKVLGELGREARHEQLASYSFAPELSHHQLKLVLELRQRVVRCRFLFVTFKSLGRRLAFMPRMPNLWFDVARGETLQDRATEVLTRHFRDVERDEGDARPQDFALNGKAWVTPLELDVQPAMTYKPVEVNPFAFLGAEDDVSDGAAELRRVGRCLDWLYPDELDRVRYRDREVAEVARLLTAADRRPLLLVGPRQVGKTAILHEFVYRQVAQRQRIYSERENVWLLSPQRLIAGMSFVGQWEKRLLAILRTAKKRGHILYFDDVLGLYLAGVSACSSLSVAHVLKPYIERREVRLVAEITPEALRVFRERDCGFADLFHILPVHEPTDEEVLRILITTVRQLEGREKCRFGLDVLPTVLDLQRRYMRGVAFPGKATGFLKRLAVKHRNADVTRGDVLGEFQSQSGLAIKLLDNRVKLERPEVLEALRQQVIGQDAALQAAADVVAIAKARLNDPDRPLASFLFLGPTGVGKTQCAKALAAFLFGDADKVLRFDMNEYVSTESAARLVGTFYQPEGLLTSAVQRRPFAVVLLDEIEKAHPDVFDLLLQVLGEGRLTDSLGRTVDFTNTIIILTSNLGVRAAEGGLGFRGDGAQDDTVFVQAAEKFFRPEFFNRLDRVVPFGRLSREEVGKIARLLIQGVFQREGLQRRKCVLQVDDVALERVVDQGYNALLGARALKRAIEKQLTQPVAARLAELQPSALTVVNLYAGKDALAVQVQELRDAERVIHTAATVDRSDPAALLRRVETAVNRIEDQAAHMRPTEPVTLGRIDPGHLRYFLIKEQVDKVRRLSREITDTLEAARTSSRGLPSLGRGVRPRGIRSKTQALFDSPGVHNLLGEIAAAQDIHEYLKEMAAGASRSGAQEEDGLTELLHQIAFLELMAGDPQESSADLALLYILAPDPGATFQGLWPSHYLRTIYRHLFEDGLGMRVTQYTVCPLAPSKTCLIRIQGPHALALARLEEGTHLFCPARANVTPAQVGVVPLTENEDPQTRFTALWANRQAWRDRSAKGDADVASDPMPLLPVLRIYEEHGPTVDIRTGLLSPTSIAQLAEADELRTFLFSVLPLPPELVA